MSRNSPKPGCPLKSTYVDIAPLKCATPGNCLPRLSCRTMAETHVAFDQDRESPLTPPHAALKRLCWSTTAHHIAQLKRELHATNFIYPLSPPDLPQLSGKLCPFYYGAHVQFPATMGFPSISQRTLPFSLAGVFQGNARTALFSTAHIILRPLHTHPQLLRQLSTTLGLYSISASNPFA